MPESQNSSQPRALGEKSTLIQRSFTLLCRTGSDKALHIAELRRVLNNEDIYVDWCHDGLRVFVRVRRQIPPAERGRYSTELPKMLKYLASYIEALYPDGTAHVRKNRYGPTMGHQLDRPTYDPFGVPRPRGKTWYERLLGDSLLTL